MKSPTLVGFFVCKMMGRFGDGDNYKKKITNHYFIDCWVV